MRFTPFSALSFQNPVCALHLEHTEFGQATFQLVSSFQLLSSYMRPVATIQNNELLHNHKSNHSLHMLSDFLKIKTNTVVTEYEIQLFSLH